VRKKRKKSDDLATREAVTEFTQTNSWSGMLDLMRLCCAVPADGAAVYSTPCPFLDMSDWRTP
jgi:hypothetical protein